MSDKRQLLFKNTIFYGMASLWYPKRFTHTHTRPIDIPAVLLLLLLLLLLQVRVS